jgi:hypothetical protein
MKKATSELRAPSLAACGTSGGRMAGKPYNTCRARWTHCLQGGRSDSALWPLQDTGQTISMTWRLGFGPCLQKS